MNELNLENESIENKLADNSIYEDQNKSALTELLEERGKLANTLESIETEWLEANEELELMV